MLHNDLPERFSLSDKETKLYLLAYFITYGHILHIFFAIHTRRRRRCNTDTTKTGLFRFAEKKSFGFWFS